MEVAQKSLKQEDDEEILEEYVQVLESIGHNLHEERSSIDSDSPEDPNHKLKNIPTELFSAPVQQLFTNLTRNGFGDFKLLFKVVNICLTAY